MKYLDTTIIADAIAGARKRKAAALMAVASSERWTSTHVRGQFRGTFLHSAVEAHSILTDSESLGEAVARVGEAFGKREMDREAKWFGLLIDRVRAMREEGDLNDDDREVAITLLERHVLLDIMAWIEELVPPGRTLDGTGCTRATDEPVFDDELGTYTFPHTCHKKPPPECHIADFASANLEAIGKLADGPDALEESNQSKAHPLRECARKVREKPTECRGEMCSIHLSDAIIAIECPDEADLCTTDGDFGPICACLGKRLHHVSVPKGEG